MLGMKRILFVSGLARARGPTAAQIFAEIPYLSTDFGGINPGADDLVTEDQIAWATMIFAMEIRQQTALSSRFRREIDGRIIITLGIRDIYTFMQPRLIAELNAAVLPHLK
jgi:predicted protein tyrosine phosphatase